jgi:hypothetical protein
MIELVKKALFSDTARYVVFEGVGTTAETAAREVGATVDYTVPDEKILLIESWFVHNKNFSARYCKMTIGNTLLVGAYQIPANDTLESSSGFKVYLGPGEQIIIQAEVADDLVYRISGIEVDA